MVATAQIQIDPSYSSYNANVHPLCNALGPYELALGLFLKRHLDLCIRFAELTVVSNTQADRQTRTRARECQDMCRNSPHLTQRAAIVPIGIESMPIQLTQCWFPVVWAISSAKI